jgi:hypothetical protein
MWPIGTFEAAYGDNRDGAVANVIAEKHLPHQCRRSWECSVISVRSVISEGKAR